MFIMLKGKYWEIKLDSKAIPVYPDEMIYDSQAFDIFELPELVKDPLVMISNDTWSSPLSSALVNYVMDIMNISFTHTTTELCTTINVQGTRDMSLISPFSVNIDKDENCYVKSVNKYIHVKKFVKFVEFINMKTHVSHTIGIIINGERGSLVDMKICMNEHPHMFEYSDHESHMAIGDYPMYTLYSYDSMLSEGFKPLYNNNCESNDPVLEHIINTFISRFVKIFGESLIRLENSLGSIYKNHDGHPETLGGCLYDMSPNEIDRFYHNERYLFTPYTKKNNKRYIKFYLKDLPLSAFYQTWFDRILKPKHIEELEKVFNGTLLEFCKQYNVKRLYRDIKGLGSVTANNINESIKRYTEDIMHLGMKDDECEIIE